MNHSKRDTMHGVYLTGHGDYDTLEYRTDIPIPSPKANEVLIRIRAAGVNNTDINTRTAWYSKGDADSEDAGWSGEALQLPRIQGADVCGEIVAVGSNVLSSRVGERVLVEPCLKFNNGQPIEHFWYFGSEVDGGFAQYAVVSQEHACVINSEFSDVELASFPCSYSTAENMLTRANVHANDTVLVTGASGGVGSAAVQLAKARGAKVIAVTSDSKAAQLIALGADETVSRNENYLERLGANSVTVVIDLVGGPNWPQLLELLSPKGRYAVSGAIGGAMVELDVRTLYLKDLSFYGCTELEPTVFRTLIERIEKQQVRPLVAKTYPLKEIVAAQKAFLTKKHTGKIVLTVE